MSLKSADLKLQNLAAPPSQQMWFQGPLRSRDLRLAKVFFEKYVGLFKDLHKSSIQSCCEPQTLRAMAVWEEEEDSEPAKCRD